MSSERLLPWFVRAATAGYGLTVGIALAPELVLRVSAHEVPGAIQAAGISPSTPMLQLVAAIALTIAGALAGNIAARKLCGTDTLVRAPSSEAAQTGVPVPHTAWAATCYCIALSSAAITLMHFGTLRHVILHGIVAAAMVPLRTLQPRFSRADVVLIPVLFSTYFALLDIGFGKTPAATFLRGAILVFALRLLAGWLATNRRPALAFVAAPLAFLFQMQWISAKAAGALALLWIVGTALLLTFLLREGSRERTVRRFATYVAFPIALAAYPLVLLGISSMPAIDFFEDGHDLMPASEMARGELPYRDVVPVHGLLSDGVLDLVAMKSGAASIGTLLKVRRVEASLNMIAIYAVAVAATGTAEGGLLAVLVGVMLWPSATLMVRVIPALAALALVVSAVRMRSRRKLLAAGAVIAIAALFSLEFAVYSAIVAIVAAMRWGGQRSRALLALFVGVIAVALPLLVVFAVIGFAGDFVTVSLALIGGGGVHVRTLLAVPDCFRSLSALVLNFAQPECFAFVMWVVALIAGAAMLAPSPLRARRRDAVWYVAMWVVVAAISYAERQHFYFAFALAPFLIGALFLM
ncbi:MAG TPA: hypothetical protein VEZ11_02800, partial [Thermoanaerobaculia bacterium]|nr:hypothetical protein [Thermoanaerobaculia bacterium]